MPIMTCLAWAAIRAGLTVALCLKAGVERRRAWGAAALAAASGAFWSAGLSWRPSWADPFTQFARFGANAAVLGLPPAVIVILAVVSWLEAAKLEKRSWKRRLAALGAVLAPGVFLLCLLFDPASPALAAGELLLPVSAAILADQRRWDWRWLAAGAAALAFHGAFGPPASAWRRARLAREEARFVAGRLGERDLLVCLSEPVRAFSDSVGAALPRVAFDWPEEKGLAGPELNGRIGATLCGGGAALLASDSLFRAPTIPPPAMDAHVDEAVAALGKQFVLQPPVVSPEGQYYYPLAPRPGALACP